MKVVTPWLELHVLMKQLLLTHVVELCVVQVSIEWPGLPAGVKFDPSDAELLEHLAGKIWLGNSKPHLFIDEFIPTLNEDEGICYTHPENLPGKLSHYLHIRLMPSACSFISLLI